MTIGMKNGIGSIRLPKAVRIKPTPKQRLIDGIRRARLFVEAVAVPEMRRGRKRLSEQELRKEALRIVTMIASNRPIEEILKEIDKVGPKVLRVRMNEQDGKTISDLFNYQFSEPGLSALLYAAVVSNNQKLVANMLLRAPDIAGYQSKNGDVSLRAWDPMILDMLLLAGCNPQRSNEGTRNAVEFMSQSKGPIVKHLLELGFTTKNKNDIFSLLRYYYDSDGNIIKDTFGKFDKFKDVLRQAIELGIVSLQGVDRKGRGIVLTAIESFGYSDPTTRMLIAAGLPFADEQTTRMFLLDLNTASIFPNENTFLPNYEEAITMISRMLLAELAKASDKQKISYLNPLIEIIIGLNSRIGEGMFENTGFRELMREIIEGLDKAGVLEALIKACSPDQAISLLMNRFTDDSGTFSRERKFELLAVKIRETHPAQAELAIGYVSKEFERLADLDAQTLSGPVLGPLVESSRQDLRFERLIQMYKILRAGQ